MAEIASFHKKEREINISRKDESRFDRGVTTCLNYEVGRLLFF
jgi:hypothetical protein